MRKRNISAMCMALAFLLCGCADTGSTDRAVTLSTVESKESAVEEVEENTEEAVENFDETESIEKTEDIEETEIIETTSEPETDKYISLSFGEQTELQLTATCANDTADYSIEIKDASDNLIQSIEYHPEDWWADSYEPKIQLQDVNRDGINDIWLYLGCSGNAVIDGWTCFAYDETQQQYVEIEGFDELSNPYMNEWLRTGAKNGWGVYVRKVYEVEGTTLRLLETLTETNVEYEGKIWLYDEEIYENGELVSKKEGVYAEEITSGYWDSVLMNTEDEYKE